jgi:hypothetical protein
MFTKAPLSLVLFAALTGTSSAAVILSENFNAAPTGQYNQGGITNTAFSAFNSVDVHGNLNGSNGTCPFSNIPANNCLDLVSNLNGLGIQSLSSFNITAGQSYRLTFIAGVRIAANFTWNGTVDFGTATLNYNVTSPANQFDWISPSWTFTAASNESNVRLRFFSNSPDLQNGIVVDDIVLETIDSQAPSGVPEPSTVALLGIGLAGIRFCRRK